MKMDGKKLYTLEDVAQRLEVTTRTVHNFVKDGRISTIPMGALRRVTEAELNRILTEGVTNGGGRRRGRPPKSGTTIGGR
jgi:excisionase family DNA binding protein